MASVKTTITDEPYEIPAHSESRVVSYAQPADWERQRKEICRRYSEHSLQWVTESMERDYGFKATPRMYKHRFERWGVAKYNKDTPRKRRQSSEGSQSSSSDDDMIKSQRVVLSRPASCVLPSLSNDYAGYYNAYSRVHRMPFGMQEENLRILEQVMSRSRDYISGSYDSGIWVQSDPATRIYSAKDPTKGDSLVDFSTGCAHALALFFTSRIHEAELMLIASLAPCRQLLRSQAPGLMHNLLIAISMFETTPFAFVARIIMEQFSHMSAEELGATHPITDMITQLDHLPEEVRRPIIERFFQAMCDRVDSQLGRHHRSALELRVNYCVYTARMSDEHEAVEKVAELLAACIPFLHLDDRRRVSLKLHFLKMLFRNQAYTQATQDIQRALMLLSSQPDNASPYMRAVHLRELSEIHYASGRVLEALEHLKEAIQLIERHYGTSDVSVLEWMLDLENWLIELGKGEKAQEIRDHRRARLDAITAPVLV